MFRSPWPLLAMAAFTFVACKPHVGDRCSMGQTACEDDAHVLVCQGGKLARASCRGPSGCSSGTGGDPRSCDDSIADEGEACLAATPAREACSPEKARALRCENGAFHLARTCRGHDGCRFQGGSLTCDARLGQLNDACGANGATACAVEGTARLVCKDGKLRLDRLCRGPAGCREADRACDESIGDVGDPCSAPGTLACSPDGTTELACRGGQLALERPCRKRGCHIRSDRTTDCE